MREYSAAASQAVSCSRMESFQIRIEASEWLVQQQQPRLGSEGTSQRHALLLATGKIGRHPPGEVAGVKELEHLRHPLARSNCRLSPERPKATLAVTSMLGNSVGRWVTNPMARCAGGTHAPLAVSTQRSSM